MLIGVVVSAILWGVSGLQTLYYFSRGPSLSPHIWQYAYCLRRIPQGRVVSKVSSKY